MTYEMKILEEREFGRNEGKIEGKIEMVLKMLKAKQPLELIREISDFSKDKIAKIAKDNNIALAN